MGRKAEISAWLASRPWAQGDSVQIASEDLNAKVDRLSAAIGDLANALEVVAGYVDVVESRLVVLEADRQGLLAQSPHLEA